MSLCLCYRTIDDFIKNIAESCLLSLFSRLTIHVTAFYRRVMVFTYSFLMFYFPAFVLAAVIIVTKGSHVALNSLGMVPVTCIFQKLFKLYIFPTKSNIMPA